MATIYWKGTATAVAQVDTGSIDSVDGTPANNTFTVTIGDVAISQVGDTDVATTAAALVVLLEASVHPYFTAITWTNPSAGNIVATADTAGVSFVAALTETGAGTGAVTDFAATTANAGPSSASTVTNYSGGALPGGSDTLIFANSADNISYNLDALTGGPEVITERTFTGLIGLKENAFTTSADGATSVATAREYREQYLRGPFAGVVIGSYAGAGSPPGSTRTKIHTTSTAVGLVDIQSTSSSSAEDYVPPVRVLTDDGNVSLNVRSGSVGIAADRPGETSTVGTISVIGSDASVTVGQGTTLTAYSQSGGTGQVKGAAATVASVDVTGGTLTVEGDFTITALTIEGGTVSDSHIKTSGNATTTANIRGGTWDLQATDAARTVNVVNHDNGGQIVDNPSVVFTTFNRARATISA